MKNNTTSLTTQGISLPEAARRYAAAGWPVFPLAPRSKSPYAGSHGHLDANVDLVRIDRWWQRHPDSNIGIACGFGFDVVDADSVGALAFLLDIAPELVDGPIVRRGDRTHFYVAPSGRRRHPGVVEKVDYLGMGGYVIAPPSVHPSGDRYEWYGVGDLRAAPVAVLDLLPAVVPETERQVVAVEVSGAGYAKAALRAECDKVTAASGVAGSWNVTINRAAFSMGTIIGAGLISEQEVVDAITAAANCWGDEDRKMAARTITAGIKSGRAEPRIVKPLGSS